MSTAARVEALRRIAGTEGIPIDCVEKLAFRPSTVARLLEVSKRTVERELDAGRLPTTWIGNSRRISTLDLVEYLDVNRTVGPRGRAPSSVDDLIESFRSPRFQHADRSA